MGTYYVGNVPFDDGLYHWGIKGQKWGIRRYQNPDGTLTPAGKACYGTETEKMAAKDAQRMSDARAAYGEGAGVRRKLLSKEINKKLETKEYKKAYEEAEKHVNVGKSLKRAEKLHKKSGTFVKGRDLANSGYKHSKMRYALLEELLSMRISERMEIKLSLIFYLLGMELLQQELLLKPDAMRILITIMKRTKSSNLIFVFQR